MYGNFIIKYRRISNRNRPIVTKYRRFCLTYLSIIIGYRTNFYRYYRTIDNEPIIDIYHHRSTTLILTQQIILDLNKNITIDKLRFSLKLFCKVMKKKTLVNDIISIFVNQVNFFR